MIKLFLIASTVVMLAGCTTTKPTILDQTTVQVIEPPKTLYKCPVIDVFPDPNKLTNRQVGTLIVQLYENNSVCAENMKKIEQFVTQAKATIAKRS